MIEGDLLKMFYDFYTGSLDISRLNYEVITLLPMVTHAEKVQQFRLIFLLNCSYKLITEVLNTRLEPFMAKLNSECQNAFIKT